MTSYFTAMKIWTIQKKLEKTATIPPLNNNHD